VFGADPPAAANLDTYNSFPRAQNETYRYALVYLSVVFAFGDLIKPTT
jgi:hypothetical protein